MSEQETVKDAATATGHWQDLVAILVAGAAAELDAPVAAYLAVRSGAGADLEESGNFTGTFKRAALCQSLQDRDHPVQECGKCPQRYAKMLLAEPGAQSRVYNCPFGLTVMACRREVREDLDVVLVGGRWAELGGEGATFQAISRLTVPEERKRRAEDLARYARSLPTPTVIAAVDKFGETAGHVAVMLRSLYEQRLEIRLGNVAAELRRTVGPSLPTDALAAKLSQALRAFRQDVWCRDLAIVGAYDWYTGHPRLLASTAPTAGSLDNVLLREMSLDELKALGDKTPDALLRIVRERLEGTDVPSKALATTISQDATACVYLNMDPYPGALLVMAQECPPDVDGRHARAAVQETLAKRLPELVASILTEVAARQALLAFVSRVSHAVRGPLNSVAGALGFLKMLMGQAQPLEASAVAKGLDFCSKAEASVSDVGAHMRDMQLALLQATFADTALTLGTHPIRRLIAGVLESFPAPGRGIEVRRVEKLLASTDGQMDFAQMSIAVENLVNNAVKYSHFNRPVTVEYGTRWNRELNQDWFYVAVSDFGVGVREDECDRIWDPHFQGSYRDPKRTIFGTGLGLALVRRILERHGGSATFTQERIGGSADEPEHCEVTFTITWPVAGPPGG